MNEIRPLTPDEVYARTQRPQDNDPGPLGKPEKPCATSVMFILQYDDAWGTRITDVPVKLTQTKDGEDDVLVDGDQRTTSLKSFGKEDGQEGVAETLKKLGVFEHKCIESDFVTFETVPEPGAEGEVRNLEGQTLDKLKAFEADMSAALKPWVDEWEKHGWLTVAGAAREGLVKGVSAWWEGESEFWGMVGDGISDGWESAKRGLRQTYEDFMWWWEELSWRQKLMHTTAIVTTLAEDLWNGAVSLFDDVVDLWERRDDFFNVIRAFVEGSIGAIESALDLLRDLPGELGEVLLLAITQSSNWIQLLNEAIRQSDVIPALGETLGRIFSQMVPNFWAEGLGSVGGYLIPELIIAIILAIIAAFTLGSGTPALAARIGQLVLKIKNGLKKASKIGAILVKMIDQVDEIAKLITRLAVNAKKNIQIKVRRATNRRHKIEVPVKRRVPPNRKSFHRQDLDDKWYDPNTGDLRWPDSEKYPRGFDGPITRTNLEPGTMIDRYSGAPGELDGGGFLSPANTPFEARALPYDPSKQIYTKYEVLKPLPVDTGKVAPWFGHPGGGVQHNTLMPVKDLIAQGYLKPVP
ncbi:MAG: TNT domain-containing protein [Pseudomonadota bacterium]